MRTLKRFAVVGLMATSALTGTIIPRPSVAQTAPIAQPPAPVFDAAAKRQAIAAAAKLLTDDYVFPDMGAKAAALLTQNLAAGQYDADTTPEAFAAQLTKDLQGLTHDKHLSVDAERVVADPPSGPPPPLPPMPPRRGLFGFIQADRLKGNIGYIVVNSFWPKAVSRLGADKTMGLIASTDALIIDLRNNRGGQADSVNYLISFFFDRKTPVHVIDIVQRNPGTPDFDRIVYSTEPTSVSYLNKPVYLIIGPNTASGGEGFAYELQSVKRATLVGQTTWGGANPGGVASIGPRLDMFVPSGRAESPVTHTNWEGKGVQPDIPASADRSFATTYAAVLHDLGRSTSDPLPDAAEAVTEAHLLPPPRTTAMPGGEVALRRMIAGLVDGHPPYDLLEAPLADDLRSQVPDIQADLRPLGALQSLTFVIVGIGQDVYMAKFEKGSRRFVLVLDEDGKFAVFEALREGQ